jgi:hypothetical protein
MTGFDTQLPFSEQMTTPWVFSHQRLKMINMASMNQRGKNQASKKDEMGDYTPFKKGGTVSSASKRGDGIAMRGKTRGRMV